MLKKLSSTIALFSMTSILLTFFLRKSDSQITVTPKANLEKRAAALPDHKWKMPANKKFQSYSKPSEITTEDSVPWEELNRKWVEEIDLVLAQQGFGPDHYLLKRYLIEKEKFNKIIGKYASELAKTYHYDTSYEKVRFIDRKEYQRINKKINETNKKHMLKVKFIFGDNYNVLQTRYFDFREAIQAYYHGEGSIGIDSAFEL